MPRDNIPAPPVVDNLVPQATQNNTVSPIINNTVAPSTLALINLPRLPGVGRGFGRGRPLNARLTSEEHNRGRAAVGLPYRPPTPTTVPSLLDLTLPRPLTSMLNSDNTHRIRSLDARRRRYHRYVQQQSETLGEADGHSATAATSTGSQQGQEEPREEAVSYSPR